MTLVDRAQRKLQTLVVEVPVTSQSKTIQVHLMSLPEHVTSRILLGVDFVNDANILKKDEEFF